MRAIVRIEINASDDRQFQLPGEGTQSLICVFGPDEKIGARATTADGRAITPGSSHESVRLDFWDPVATDFVRAGRDFEIWYGGTVGRGTVQSIDDEEP